MLLLTHAGLDPESMLKKKKHCVLDLYREESDAFENDL